MTDIESHIAVRSAETKDADTIVEFNRAMARETEDKELPHQDVTRGVRSLLEHPDGGFYLVAVDKHDEVVGCVMVTFEWSDWRNGVFWWMQSVYVRPDYRRRGVFTRLFQHVQQRARQRPEVCGLRLYVEQENQIAQHTYGALGMRQTPYRVYECEFSRK